MNRSNTSPGFFWAFNVDVAKHRCGWIPNPISKTSTAIRNRWEDPGIAAYRPIDPTKGEMIMASPIPMLMDSPMGGTYCSYHLFFKHSHGIDGSFIDGLPIKMAMLVITRWYTLQKVPRSL